MKHISLFLSVLFWAVASVSMAVTLPSSSYSLSVVQEEQPFTSPFGTTFKNISLLTTYTSGNCTGGKEDYSRCNPCCLNEICPGKTEKECWEQKPAELGDCIDYCSGTELGGTDSPLDAPVYVPLSFILAYAGFIFYRRRKENVEQA